MCIQELRQKTLISLLKVSTGNDYAYPGVAPLLSSNEAWRTIFLTGHERNFGRIQKRLPLYLYRDTKDTRSVCRAR